MRGLSILFLKIASLILFLYLKNNPAGCGLRQNFNSLFGPQIFVISLQINNLSTKGIIKKRHYTKYCPSFSFEENNNVEELEYSF
ncbi:hypothetical protein EG347_08160 [Chryseobacterium sp. G0186]|nr:hypothetical protein EG347_08160 [Chryseobacterium sp. G0186]